MPRKLALTPELEKKLLMYLRLGNYVDTACRAVGIHKDTLYGWLERAKKGHTKFQEFANRMDEAVAEAEARDLATIQKASQSQWQAAAWRLERRYPERWGRREKHELTGAGGGPLQTVDVSQLSDDQLERISRGDLTALASAGGTGSPKT